MKKIIILSLIAFNANILAKSWAEIINEKLMGSNDASYAIIIEQYESCVNNSAPAIANPVIKNIPIIENQEELIDIYSTNNSRISMLPSPLENKYFYGPDYNSGLPGASKIRKEIYNRLQKMVIYLDKLSELFGYTPGEVSIKVFEGLRDLKSQENLFNNKLNEIKLSNPNLTEEQAEIETSKWVSPVKNNIPVHSTGAAIDIRLWNEKISDFIDLGKFGVIWGENKTTQTFSENITDVQKLNRLYLLMAAARAGLTNYTFEYWHFSFGDRYAMYWLEKNEDKRIACYNAVH